MQYPVSFMTGKREVILDGEAYFEVVHNEKSPFVVHTSTLDVKYWEQNLMWKLIQHEKYSKRL